MCGFAFSSRADIDNPKTMDCLNLGSYNYLGFADDWQSSCKKEVMETFDQYAVGTCAARLDLGTSDIHNYRVRIIDKSSVNLHPRSPSSLV